MRTTSFSAHRRRLCLWGAIAAAGLTGSGAPGAEEPSPEKTEWEPLPESELGAFAVADFADDELEVPFMLRHFARVAGSIVEQGPNRGFIDLPVYREPKDNRPYNARVLEVHVALSYFYVTERPWNPYFAHPALRARLEAMLEFWCGNQNPETGFFTEYGPKDYSLAPTGFAVVMMSRTLERLSAEGAPPFDTLILERAFGSQRKAIMALLTRRQAFERGSVFSNQWAGVIRAALAHLQLRPDEAMRKALIVGVARAAREFQSPLGFFYEAVGADSGYTVGLVHLVTLAVPLLETVPEVHETVVAMHRRWAQWLGYNLVLQPGTREFLVNAGVNTRTSHWLQAPAPRPIAKWSEPDRVFAETQAERERRRMARREALERSWPQVPALEVPSNSAYNPRRLFYASAGITDWTPTDEEREVAIARLPYFRSREFTTLGHDGRAGVSFLFVRRPGYYAVLNSGRIRVAGRQCYGLGLLWHEQAGALVQAVAGTRWAWGMRKPGQKGVMEMQDVEMVMEVDGAIIKAANGMRDLPVAQVVATYALQGVRKTVVFEREQIMVELSAAGPMIEQVPLVRIVGDVVEAEGASVRVVRGTSVMTIEADNDAAVSVGPVAPAEPDRTEYRRSMVNLTGNGTLKYTISMQ